tara:strand:+ start:245 stop:1051 length:807 start_codon:yes stop_codon:yes gene_type:complete
MARKKPYTDNFADLVARLNKMSNMTPEEERASLMEAASQEPKILDEKDVTLADIAKLAGIKEYAEETKVSPKAEKLVESITAETKEESSITKAIKESDADDSISTSIKKAVNEETKRLDKIAELETQLAELKAEEKQDATMDDKTFREVFLKDITEFVKDAEANDLVEMYNTFSNNEVEMNEDSFIMKTPETKEIIADAEQAEAPEEEVVQEKEPEAEEPTLEEPTEAEVPVEEQGEDVELDVPAKEEVIEVPAEDKFTNDLDPAEKK